MVTTVQLNGALGTPPQMEAVFIRAPRITRLGDGVKAMAWLESDPVLVASGSIVAATFHPELSSDLRVHRLFCGLGANQ
jgi:5'-phosphate synthase pdxT subunit